MTRPLPQQFSDVDRRPLTSYERKLIETASTKLWGSELHYALLNAVLNRGVRASPRADCGELADTLALTGERS